MGKPDSNFSARLRSAPAVVLAFILSLGTLTLGEVASASTADPAATVSTASGRAPGQVRVHLRATSPTEGCRPNCRIIQIRVRNMQPGNYRVHLRQTGVDRPASWRGQYRIRVGEDRTGKLLNRFYTGFPGRVTVTVNGVRGSS